MLRGIADASSEARAPSRTPRTSSRWSTPASACSTGGLRGTGTGSPGAMRTIRSGLP